MSTTDLSERLVDALNASYGVHPGQRAAHARGVLCSATFHPLAAAATLCRAPHLSGGPHRAHVRFSNGSGDPTIADGVRDARGMAVKIYLPDGATTDVVGITLPVFFVRTPEELLAFNEARRPDPATGLPDLDKVGAFLAEHPETVPAVTAAMTAPLPESYARLAYHALHAFQYVAADGSRRAGRAHLVPDAGEASISDEDAAARAPDYLHTELASRVAREPAVFHLEVEFAEPGDPLDDPTAVWGAGRERLRIARIEITGLAFDREVGGDVLVFDPTRVPDGIELSDDPILRARSGAYRTSVARRTAPPPRRAAPR
jgi:catalase